MVKLKDIVEKFGLTVIGDVNREIIKITSIENQFSEGLTWSKAQEYVEKVTLGTVLVNEEIEINPKEGVTYIITKTHPKIALSKLIKEFFPPSVDYYLVNEVETHRRNLNLKISEFVFIGQNVKIGDNTVIFPFVVIEADTIIGENCVIKPHVSIASEGLGTELNVETDLLEKLPQIGNVVIGNHVDIGPNTTVRRGTLGSTVIKDGCKIGSMINVGHNCKIGKNVTLTCNIVTSGSSVIGDYTYIGVNAVIRNGITVGKKCYIGMGTVVTKSLPDNIVAYGNPAKVIRQNEP